MDFCGDENILALGSGDSKSQSYESNKWTMYFKQVNFMACALYF